MNGRPLTCLKTVVLLFSLLAAGCEHDPPYSSEEDDDFRITTPPDGAVVNQRWGCQVRGSGLKSTDIGSSSLDVFTDEWYHQTGAAVERVGNGDGWVAYVNLGGQDEFNSHAIRAIVSYSDGSEDTAEVKGVVVRE